MTMVRRIITPVTTIFLSVSIVLFLTCLLATVYYLISDPGVLEDVNSVVTFIAELLGGSAIMVALARRFKKQLQASESVSAAITSFLSGEPIVVAFLWIFIIVQSITFTYLLPIHAVLVEVKNDPAALADSHITLSISPDRVTLTDYRATEHSVIFRTSRAYRWGDSLHISITADGFEDYNSTVKWSGFSFLELTSGYRIPSVSLRAQHQHLQVQATPEFASIAITSDNIDTVFTGRGRIVTHRDAFVSIEVGAENYRPQHHEFAVSGDTVLQVALDPRPATLTLRAYSEGGVEYRNMTIFINGSETDYKTGDNIILTPARYTLHLRQEREDSFLFVEEFSVVLQPGQRVVKEDLIVRVTSK